MTTEEEKLNEEFKKAEQRIKKNPSEELIEAHNRLVEKGLIKPRNPDGKKKIIQTSLYIDEDDGTFAEQVYDGVNTKFCIYNTKTKIISYSDYLEFGEVIIDPITDEELDKKAILLPSKVEEYGNDEKLDKDIYDFITKWLDIPEDTKRFAVWNIKRSWVYENFHTLNYLRAMGDTGTGKTRYLDVLGHIHYKPINTSGATTSAPVFRIIDKWRGTLVIDEADFQKSDESQDIIKIINMGYERGKFVMRCDKDKGNKVNFFDPFCPKILATRKVFTDKATESRCITNVMLMTSRKDIPLNLNKEFFETAQKLRNKLLMWRFKNYYKINPDVKIDFDMGELEPRVKQIISSFISLFGGDKKQLKNFKVFINNYQEELITERKDSFAGQVVEAIHKLIEKGEINISSQDIIIEGNITNRKGEYVTPRGLSSTLKGLGFGKTKLKKVEGEVKRCIPINSKHLEMLFKRYGFEVTVVTKVTKVTVDTDTQLPIKTPNNDKSLDTVTTVTTVTPLPEETIKDTPNHQVTPIKVPPPNFDEIDEPKSVIAKVREQDKVYAYIKQNPLKSYEDIQKATRIPESDFIKVFEGLKSSGDIVESKPNRWQVLE